MEGYSHSQDEYPSYASLTTYGNESQNYATTTSLPYTSKTAAPASYTTNHHDNPREKLPVSNTPTSKYIASPYSSYSTQYNPAPNHNTGYTYNDHLGSSSTPQTPYTTRFQTSTTPKHDADTYYEPNYDDYNSPHTSRDPNPLHKGWKHNENPAGNSYVRDEISQFVSSFQRNRKHYLKLEKEIGTKVKQKLDERRIEHLWQSRVKEPDSLEAKLRNRTHQYNNDQKANCAAIKDLMAGRIILPWLDRDLPAVRHLIQKHFKLVGETQHPKPGSSSGYAAHHFYMTMRTTVGLLDNVTIEIQVMSPFTYGYVAQEHDIRYKQLQGVITLDDIINLEQLQSAAQQGNAASKRLQGRYIE